MEIFNECIRNNYDTNSARDYASICLTGEAFHKYEDPNNNRGTFPSSNGGGFDQSAQSIPS